MLVDLLFNRPLARSASAYEQTRGTLPLPRGPVLHQMEANNVVVQIVFGHTASAVLFAAFLCFERIIGKRPGFGAVKQNADVLFGFALVARRHFMQIPISLDVVGPEAVTGAARWIGINKRRSRAHSLWAVTDSLCIGE